ncbi:MAG: hypothetical protein IPK50_17075 [Fibrobacterota bacterium]|nr:hypothetical protein [Fibrobacterota bacterium]QQS03993.1 MAG: hypothetical protein IPK50_17075 [Fibrobacterota bacterium]
MINDDEIEIYLGQPISALLIDFIKNEFDDCDFCIDNSDGTVHMSSESLFVSLAESEFSLSSCWIKGRTKWSSDVEFARYCSKKIGCKVLCDPGLSFPDIPPHPNQFFRIENGIETLINIDDWHSKRQQ